MDYKEYLEKAKTAEIRINGLSGTTKIIKRPTLNKLKEILKDRFNGTFTFQDEFFAEATQNIVVSEGQLWYGDEFIATHKLPDIHLLMGDTLTWVYNLSITAQSGRYIIHV